MKILSYIFALMFLIACGSSTTSDDSDDTDAETLEELLEGGVAIDDLDSEITGSTFAISSYALTETSEVLGVLAATTYDTITFPEDGILTDYSASPLYDYTVSVYSTSDLSFATGCAETMTNVEDGTSIIDSNLFDYSLTYEVVETGASPLLKFYLSGKEVNGCCGTYIGACEEIGWTETYEEETRTTSYVIDAADTGIFAIETDDYYIVLIKE